MRNRNESRRNNIVINQKETGLNCNIIDFHTSVIAKITVYLAAIPCYL